MRDWENHLNCTLFADGFETWGDMHDIIWHHERHWSGCGCTTQAPRNFLVECRNCHQAVRADYTKHQSDEVHEAAR